ncbi:MAG TPA: endonuclease/exonuclease/phosphatase family protein [Burkholderiaceae bacterium]|nr:endonuclease/exonuclease/phosphatase family protein [Burkholderiaceae bacterium]
MRIATLNCLNFTLPGRVAYAQVAPLTDAEYAARVEWLAAMLRRLDADLVLLQEIFHERALAAAVARVGDERTFSSAAPLATDDNDKPRLGLAWRAPWQPTIETIRAFPPGLGVPLPDLPPHEAFSRPILCARVAIEDRDGRRSPLVVFNVHLKSRRPILAGGETDEDASARARGRLRALVARGAEAAALRSLVVASLSSGAAVVVGGDFNDGIAAETTMLVGDPVRPADAGVAPPESLVDVLQACDGPAPWRTAPAPTHIDGGAAERIDHLLVSRHFDARAAGADEVRGRVLLVETLGDHLLERRRGAGEDGPDPARIASDHAAVCVTLDVGPAR